MLVFVTIGNFFISSLALAINLYTSEIYPTRIRAFAGAVGGAWQRVAAILGTNVVAWLLPFGTGSLQVPLFRRLGDHRRRVGVVLRNRNQRPLARRAVAL